MRKRGSPKGRQGVHLTPWQLTWRGGVPRDARAFIRPLGKTDCPTPATQKRRCPNRRQGIDQTPCQCILSDACHTKRGRAPRGHQGVYQTPWQFTLSHACYGKETELQSTPGDISDPWQCTLSHAYHAKEVKPEGTPGRTSNPLAAYVVTPATRKRRSPKGQGVHLTTWQCTSAYACHAKEAKPQGTPGHISNPLVVQIISHLPRKKGGVPRDTRTYIRSLSNVHCFIPTTQKRRSPKGCQGIHQTHWQCALSHACHAKAAEPQGTPGRTSDPLAMYIVPCLPRKRREDPKDAKAYIRPLSSVYYPTPTTQKRRSPKGRQDVHPTL